MAVTMEKKGSFEKQVAANVDGVLKGFLDYILQNQNNGLLTRGRVTIVKTGEDALWQKTMLIYLDGFKGIFKWNEEVIPVKPKSAVWGTRWLRSIL